jgi:hypothetical protein
MFTALARLQWRGQRTAAEARVRDMRERVWAAARRALPRAKGALLEAARGAVAVAREGEARQGVCALFGGAPREVQPYRVDLASCQTPRTRWLLCDEAQWCLELLIWVNTEPDRLLVCVLERRAYNAAAADLIWGFVVHFLELPSD